MSNNQNPCGIGLLSILIILIVLALATFAALAFSTAQYELNLSRINADTVSAYYQTDAQAAEAYARFAAGNETELDLLLPINNIQSLRLWLFRRPDGTIDIRCWQTLPNNINVEPENEYLPIWNGK